MEGAAKCKPVSCGRDLVNVPDLPTVLESAGNNGYCNRFAVFTHYNSQYAYKISPHIKENIIHFIMVLQVHPLVLFVMCYNLLCLSMQLV